VPFVDVRALYGECRNELIEAFTRVLDSGAYVAGREVSAFEDEFKAAYPARHALAVSNGTAALHLALLAIGAGPGDEVILPANTFIATAEAISMTGARPVFADIESDGFNIDPASVARCVTPRTKAIVAVHLYGRVANLPELSRIARANRISLIEDACQAHGAILQGRPAGTIGDIGCLSFYPTKNLGTVGEGGMVLTANASIAARVASLRDHGQTSRHVHAEPGYNYRMPELQAAALRVLLPHLNEWNERRRFAALAYNNGLANAGVELPAPGDPRSHVYHLYVVRSTQRDELQRLLAARGIGTAIHYPTPIHRQPAYADADPDACLRRTETAVAEILSLPMHPRLTPADVAEVCCAVRECTQLLAQSPTPEEVPAS
jgi:dTDP-4-amino-4,6-dideoxygalactose transaminase